MRCRCSTRLPALLLALSTLLLLSACAGTPPVTTPAPQRAKPVQAMQPCPSRLSHLPANFETLQEVEQVKALELAHIADAAAYFPCKVKQEGEADWINGGNP